MRRSIICTILFTFFATFVSSKPYGRIPDRRIRRLAPEIFYIPPFGAPYMNASELRSSSDACYDICVPFQLCVNGNILTTGAGILKPRMGLDENTGQLKFCGESEKCCKFSDADLKNEESVEQFGAVEVMGDLSDEKEGDMDYQENSMDYEGSRRPKCGTRQANLIQARISGSLDTSPTEFPWMAVVLVKTPNSKYFDYECGGSLIHPSAIITAAHCVIALKPKFLYVRTGEWDMQKVDESIPRQDREVLSILIHHDFIKSTLRNDIAILVLKTPVELTHNVNTICLPPPNYIFRKENCVVSGWGKESPNFKSKFQTILKKVEIPIVPHSVCQKMFRKTILGKYFRLDRSFICAGGETGIDTCKGDGGSPLVCQIPKTEDSYYQAGIVSWGVGCSEKNIPGAYVNVARYRDWIDNSMQKMSLETTYYTHTQCNSRICPK